MDKDVDPFSKNALKKFFYHSSMKINDRNGNDFFVRIIMKVRLSYGYVEVVQFKDTECKDIIIILSTPTTFWALTMMVVNGRPLS